MVITHYEYCEVTEERLSDDSLVYAVESVDLVRFDCINRDHAEMLAEQIDKCVDVVTL